VIPRSGTQKTRSRRCSEQLAITPIRMSGAERPPALRNEIGGQEVEASENQIIYQQMSET